MKEFPIEIDKEITVEFDRERLGTSALYAMYELLTSSDTPKELRFEVAKYVYANVIPSMNDKNYQMEFILCR